MVEPTIAGSGDHDQRRTPPGASDGFEVPLGLRPLFDRRTTHAFDLAVMGLAFGLAYLLRFEFAVPLEHRHNAVHQLPLVLAVQFTALYLSGENDLVGFLGGKVVMGGPRAARGVAGAVDRGGGGGRGGPGADAIGVPGADRDVGVPAVGGDRHPVQVVHRLRPARLKADGAPAWS